MRKYDIDCWDVRCDKHEVEYRDCEILGMQRYYPDYKSMIIWSEDEDPPKGTLKTEETTGRREKGNEMSITYELRKFTLDNDEVRQDILSIASRIDKAVTENYIKLPEDKNKKSVPFKDKIILSDGSITEVSKYIFSMWSKEWYLVSAGTGREHWVRDCILLEPDTQEKIDADAKKASCEYWEMPQIGCDDCKHSSHQSGNSCERNMFLDLLRRQRRLDGVK